MTTLSTAMLAMAMIAPQGPSVGNYEKALVLREVRRVGFPAPQVLALRDGAWSVRQANVQYDAKIQALQKLDDELEVVVRSLAAGTPVSGDLARRFETASRQRNAAREAWDQLVNAAVTKVLGTLSDDQRYVLGVPEGTRRTIENTWNQVRSATGEEWDRLARSLSSRLMREQYNQMRRANSGGSDRGAQEDRRGRSQESRAMREEMERQGRAYLENVRRGDPTLTKAFKQLMAESYLDEGAIEANLRKLIHSIITAPGAPEALDEAVRARS